METKAKRTLVKSAPEASELADDPNRMESWMSGLVGAAQPLAVEVTDREPERVLAWRCADPGAHARIAIELTASGFGTAVRITAQHARPDPGEAIAALEGLLDELDPQSDAPSDRPEPERPPPGGALDLASLLRLRSGPLVEALDRHLAGSREHAEATASYAFAGAVGLGFERAQCEVARELAMIHEIGLIYVPAAIAAKPPRERDEHEREAWEGHYEAGYRLARGAGLPEHVCEWLLRARERHDGSGPEGLEADAIPIESRLIRAACACQTEIAAAPAQPGESPVAAALAELDRRAGSDLDPRVVAALSAILSRAAS